MNMIKIKKAFAIMESAATQNHALHYYQNGTHCPECARAKKLRKEAKELFCEALGEYGGR